MTDSWFCAGRLGAVALIGATLAWSPSSAAAADGPPPTFAPPDAAVEQTAPTTLVAAGSRPTGCPPEPSARCATMRR